MSEKEDNDSSIEGSATLHELWTRVMGYSRSTPHYHKKDMSFLKEVTETEQLQQEISQMRGNSNREIKVILDTKPNNKNIKHKRRLEF